MTQAETDFDAVFKKRGGLFTPDDKFEVKVNRMFGRVRYTVVAIIDQLHQRYPTIPEINFNFINSDKLNASVTFNKDKYYLGINSGVFFLIEDMFLKMFACNDVFKTIGNLDAETIEDKKLSALVDDGVIKFDYDANNVFKPKDNLRNSCANLYTDFALEFLIRHELCHIIRGHVAYKHDVLGNEFWSEFDYGHMERPQLPADISQTLEMDADSFAVNHAFILFKNLIAIAPMAGVKTRKPDDYFLIGDPNPMLFDNIGCPGNFTSSVGFYNLASYYKHWVTAIYALFRLFRFDLFDEVNDRALSHPPAPVRMSMVLSTVYTLLIHYNIPDEKEIRGVILPALDEAEKAFTAITYQDNKLKGFARTVLQSKEFETDIAKNWNKVRPLLQPFAFGELPQLRPD